MIFVKIVMHLAYAEKIIGKASSAMNIKLLGFILFIQVTLISCSGSVDNTRLLKSNATVLAFGDSLTFGTGANKGEDYPSRLAILSGMRVVNAGIPGEISSEGLQRLPKLLQEHNPDLVILIHGGNDILRKLPRKALKENLLAMIDLSKSSDTHVVILGVPEPGLFLQSAEIYEHVGEEANIAMELSLLPKVLGKKSLKSDIAHPNAKGYEVMANGIYEFLRNEKYL